MDVDLVDRMGTDLTVVNSARVSFAKESKWDVEEIDGIDEHGAYTDLKAVLSEKDQKLIKYLASHGHWTPFSHVQITMREKVPIFVARQRFKHMVGFTYNELSRRYVDGDPEFYTPDTWRGRAENKKQGSSEETIEFPFVGASLYDWDIFEISDWHEAALRVYNALLNNGVAPEQARMVLPQSMYTEYYVTGSLAAWSRAYKLRSTSEAQREIQDLAQQWDTIISNIPELTHSWRALKDVA